MDDEALSSRQLMELADLFSSIFRDWTEISLTCRGTMAGWETTIYKVQAEYMQNGRKCQALLVLRVYQGKGQSKKALKEYSIMKRLHELGYRVPKVYHMEQDLSLLGNCFLVMEFIDGAHLSHVHDNGDEETKNRLVSLFVRTLADLHSIDPMLLVGDQVIDPIDEITVPSAGCETSNSMVLGFLGYLKAESSAKGIKSLYDAFELLEKKLPEIEPSPLCLTHCDYHGSNVILTPDSEAVVLDWGQVRLGDYRYDLAWTFLLSNAGVGTAMRQKLLKQYSEFTGRNAADLWYFDALASALRLAATVISLRVSPEEFGMRAGAVEEMKSSAHHMAGVYAQFYEILGMRIPELEEIFPELTEVVSGHSSDIL